MLRARSVGGWTLRERKEVVGEEGRIYGFVGDEHCRVRVLCTYDIVLLLKVC